MPVARFKFSRLQHCVTLPGFHRVAVKILQRRQFYVDCQLLRTYITHTLNPTYNRMRAGTFQYRMYSSMRMYLMRDPKRKNKVYWKRNWCLPPIQYIQIKDMEDSHSPAILRSAVMVDQQIMILVILIGPKNTDRSISTQQLVVNVSHVL